MPWLVRLVKQVWPMPVLRDGLGKSAPMRAVSTSPRVFDMRPASAVRDDNLICEEISEQEAMRIRIAELKSSSDSSEHIEFVETKAEQPRKKTKQKRAW